MAEKFTKETIIDAIIDLVVEERLSITAALGKVGCSKRTFYDWQATDSDFAHRVELLRSLTHWVMEDRLSEKAADESIEIRSRQLQVDTDKWILARRVDRFRDKSSVDVTSKGERILVLDL